MHDALEDVLCSVLPSMSSEVVFFMFTVLFSGLPNFSYTLKRKKYTIVTKAVFSSR